MLWLRNICTSNQYLSLHWGSWVFCKCGESKFRIKMSWRNSFLGMLPVPSLRVTLTFRLRNLLLSWLILQGMITGLCSWRHWDTLTCDLPDRELLKFLTWGSCVDSKANRCSPLLTPREKCGTHVCPTLATSISMTLKPHKWTSHARSRSPGDPLPAQIQDLFLNL